MCNRLSIHLSLSFFFSLFNYTFDNFDVQRCILKLSCILYLLSSLYMCVCCYLFLVITNYIRSYTYIYLYKQTLYIYIYIYRYYDMDWQGVQKQMCKIDESAATERSQGRKIKLRSSWNQQLFNLWEYDSFCLFNDASFWFLFFLSLSLSILLGSSFVVVFFLFFVRVSFLFYFCWVMWLL